MSDKTKGLLLTLLEIVLCLTALYCLFWAWFGFSYAAGLPKAEPYLAPERMEERQGIWHFFGAVSAIGAILSMGIEIALRRYRRKQKKEHR